MSTVEIHRRHRRKPVILITTRHPDLAWKRSERGEKREREGTRKKKRWPQKRGDARLFREEYTPYLSAEILFPSWTLRPTCTRRPLTNKSLFPARGGFSSRLAQIEARDWGTRAGGEGRNSIRWSCLPLDLNFLPAFDLLAFALPGFVTCVKDLWSYRNANNWLSSRFCHELIPTSLVSKKYFSRQSLSGNSTRFVAMRTSRNLQSMKIKATRDCVSEFKDSLFWIILENVNLQCELHLNTFSRHSRDFNVYYLEHYSRNWTACNCHQFGV